MVVVFLGPLEPICHIGYYGGGGGRHRHLVIAGCLVVVVDML